MDPKQNEIAVFIALYQKEYALTLTVQQATEELAKLRQLYRLVYLSPIPGNAATATQPIFPSNQIWYNAPATHKTIS